MFYRSLRRVWFAFGDLTFCDERRFRRPERVVDYVRRHRFDQVLMPNPYGNPQRLGCYRALRAAGVSVIASDRGALPGSWFFDHGFNHDSPSYAPAAWDHPIDEADRHRAAAYIESLRRGSQALERQGPRARIDELAQRFAVGKSKVLFVPLQRPSDTAVRYFSAATDGMDGFLRLVVDVARQLSDWVVLLKQHPLEDALPPIRRKNVRLVGSDVHVHDLLQLCDATLALSSGVGLLSVLFDKPTVHTGRAFYGQPGLSRPAENAASAAAAIRAAAPPDREKVLRFTHHLLTRVYSFGAFRTEIRRRKDGTRHRVTVDIRFSKLRCLGRDVPLPEPRVLVVSPVSPWPARRGSEQRVDAMLRSIIESGARTSLAVLDPSPRPQSAAGLRAHYPELERVEVTPHPRCGRLHQRLGYYGGQLLNWLDGSRHRISNRSTCPPIFVRRMARMIDGLAPDAVFINYAKLTAAMPRDFSGVAIVDTHDHQTQFLRQDQALNGLRRHINPERFEASERAALQRYHHLIAINRVEAPFFARAAEHAVVHVIPAFCPAPPPGAPSAQRAYDAVFVGSVSNFNVKGLLWFMDCVLPMIRVSRPDFSLAVVGSVGQSRELVNALRARGAGNDVRRTPARRADHTVFPGVDLVGIVPSVQRYYEASNVVLAPLLGGAGMKIKVVEALAAGKAVVCTTHAAEGIDVEHKKSAWVADTPASFASGVVTLCADASIRSRVERGARALHRRAHSAAAVRGRVAALLDTIRPETPGER